MFVKKLKKKLTVITNDPLKTRIGLTITGDVEKIVTIIPSRVWLIGTAGESLSQSVEIIPEKKYDFKIVEARAKKGEHITVSIREKKPTEGSGFVMTVLNLKTDQGRYVDTIMVKTTSEIKPTIQIQVFGKIT